MYEFKTFYELLKNNALKYGDKTAILYDTFEVSYKKLFADVVKKALHLQRYKGKRIAIYGPASYRWIVNFFGIILAGKDVVLIDFFIPRNTRDKMLDDTSVDYVLCSTNQYILSNVKAIMIDGAEKDDVSGLVYDESTQEGNIIIFTSTAKECDKGVILTSSNIMAALDKLSKCGLCNENDKVLSQVALSQIFGLLYSFIWPISAGACLCVGRGLRHIDADTYYYNPTILPANPSMIEYLKKIKAFNQELKCIIVGGAPCPLKLCEDIKENGIEIYTIYGEAQSTGCVAISNCKDDSYEVMGEDSVYIADNGEIMLKDGCVMAGFNNDDTQTSAFIEDGVLHTGDFGRFNDKGHLIIEKRNAGIITLPTGESICKKVVDNKLAAMNDVKDGCVCMYDNKLTAVMVKLNDNITPERIQKHIDKYNEENGYRWEIQKVVTINHPINRLDDGQIDEKVFA